MKKFFRALCGILFVTLLIASCFSACNNRKTITINYGGSYSNALVLIMKEKNIAAKYFNGYDIQWTYMAASPDIRDAIVANRITFGGISIPSYLLAIEKGLKMETVCYSGDTPIKLYMRRDANRTYLDLNSSDRIALVGLNTILHIAFLADVYDSFGSINQFESSFVVMPHADGLSLLASGNEISAYITTFPTTIKADADENLVCVKDFTETVYKYSIGSATVTSSTTTTEEREAFIMAMEESLDYIMSNTYEAAQIMADDWSVNVEDVLAVLQVAPPKVEIEDYSKLQELLYKIGYLHV